MNRLPSALAVLAAVAASLPSLRADAAAAAPAAPTVTVTATPSFVSQYMFRGYRIGGPAFEPEIEADAGNLAVGVWGNFPIADPVPGQSDPEIDPYASYTVSVNDKLSLIPGIQIYTYPNTDVGDGNFRATVEPNFAVSTSLGPVKLTPKIYYDVVLRSTTLELNAAASAPLKAIGSELDFTGTYGGYLADNWVNTGAAGGPDTRAWGAYWLAGVSMPFQIPYAGTLSIGYAYTQGFDSGTKLGSLPEQPNPQTAGRSVWTVSLAHTF